MTARLARWRVALRIARRDALRSKGRTALVVLLMMLPVAAGAFVVGGIRTSTPTTETRISWQMGSSAQARLSVGCGDVRAPIEQDPLGTDGCDSSAADLGAVDPGDLASLLPRGDDVTPAGRVGLPIRSGRALVRSAEFLVLDAASVPGLLGEVEGHAGPGTGQIVLRRQIADRLGVGIGDRVELDSVEVEVVGIGDSSSPVAGLVGASTVGGSEPIWFVVGDAPVTWGDVQNLNAIGMVVASRAVYEDPPPPEQVPAASYGDSGDTARVVGVIAAVVALGLLEIVLLVGPAFAVGAKRNARMLALVAASGGAPGDVRRIVLASGLVAGVIAGVVGLAVGSAGTVVWFLTRQGSTYPLPNLVIPVLEPAGIAAIALLLGLAAAWFPARSAASADVVMALAGRRGDVPARRRVAWTGLSLAGAGVAMGVVAATVSEPVLLAVGVIVMEIGLVMAAGMLVELVGRLAPMMRLPARFALRDARRHRSRTAPAVAAVLAAVAAATVGLVWIASDARVQEAIWRPVAADQVGLVSLSTWDQDAEGLVEQYDRVERAIGGVLPQARMVPVRLLESTTHTGPNSSWSAAALPDPATVCPEDQEYSEDATDERCRVVPSASAGFTWGSGALVDDGSMVGALGLDGAAAAADALSRGEVVVNDPEAIWPDGRVHLTVMDDDYQPATAEVTARGHLVEWASQAYDLVVPPPLAEDLEGAAQVALADRGERAGDADPGGTDAGDPLFGIRTAGAVVTGVDLDQADVDSLNRDLSDIDANVRLTYEGEMGGKRSDADLAAIIVGAALVVALLATGLSVGLAVTDSRADLATLSAVGASPRVRRRITSAQAGVVAIVGTLAGVSTGLLLAFVIGRWQQTDRFTGYLWETIVPWPHVGALAIGLPLLAVAGGWLLSRSRLPVRRRLAQ
ncbi:FtsX-like permease family protein [Pseudactinotalea sp. HY160]|uniref:ABC transporter permease n=1 Tax=Pseudactinotalea sp. HY160 TaxID=2654490 RepID=UPI00128DE69E|nr:ABC transporter permease [Pseudactinotalea sp. HY160]MPV50687.1 FtsX-like permease family protein [Pseudactinotalea sp. HY160]